MTKVSLKKVPENTKKEILEDLFNILRMAEDKEEVIQLLIGGLTNSEITMLSNRLNVARMIFDGYSYRMIRKELGVGYSTITTTDKLINTRNEKFSKILKKYFGKIYTEPNFKKRKGGLYNYPGHALAMKVLGIEALDNWMENH